MATGPGRSRDLLGGKKDKDRRAGVSPALSFWAPVSSHFASRSKPLHAKMVSKLGTSEPTGEAARIERQHCRVPFVPLRDEPFIDAAVPLFQVCSLHRITNDIEQKGVVEDLQVLPIAVARGLLVVVFVAPEQLASDRSDPFR